MRPHRALLPLNFDAYIRLTSPALGFLFEWIILTGFGVPKSSGNGLNREFHLFGDSFVPLSHAMGTNSLKSWLYSTRAPCGHSLVPASSSIPVMQLL